MFISLFIFFCYFCLLEFVFKRKSFDMDSFMKSRLAKFYTDNSGLTLKKVGNTITRPDLAKTLDSIADNGADIFYGGSLAVDIVQTVSYFHVSELTLKFKKV